MSDEFPKALQIEVTNKCNFNCQMCIRHVWKAKPLDMDLALFQKIASLELFGRAYGVKMDTASTQLIKNFWMEAEKKGYWINLPLLLNFANTLEMLNRLKDVFHESEKAAHEYQIDLRLPNLYSDAEKRSCPYIEKKTLVVRSDARALMPRILVHSPCLC